MILPVFTFFIFLELKLNVFKNAKTLLVCYSAKYSTVTVVALTHRHTQVIATMTQDYV